MKDKIILFLRGMRISAILRSITDLSDLFRFILTGDHHLKSYRD